MNEHSHNCLHPCITMMSLWCQYVSNERKSDCLFKNTKGQTIKTISMFFVTGPLGVTGGFAQQKSCNTEIVSISCRVSSSLKVPTWPVVFFVLENFNVTFMEMVVGYVYMNTACIQVQYMYLMVPASHMTTSTRLFPH